MTTSLYGDDLTTSSREGFKENDILYFSFNGEIIDSDIIFQGNMERKEVDLVFGEGTSFDIIPNPINDFATINFTVSQESLLLTYMILLDENYKTLIVIHLRKAVTLLHGVQIIFQKEFTLLESE